MGVKQDFYFSFASFLARNGFAAMTFDYRGVGASAPATLRGFPCTVTDWATKDYNAALHAARAWQPDAPLLVVGHSLGGQLPGLVPDRHLIDALLTVAAGSGYWRENAPRLKRFVWWLWFFVVPVALPVFGYFPGKRLRKIGDLPRGVMAEWRRWCLSPHYVSDEAGRPIRDGYQAVRFPICSFSFTDDELLSAVNIERLHACYANAPVTFRRVAPADVGARRIGHFGFFRPELEGTLWTEALEWLDGRSRQLNP